MTTEIETTRFATVTMNRGFQAETSGAWPVDPGSSQIRVRPTTERPVASTSGAFRTVCGISALGFDDPIVYPGEPWRSHLHIFAGNTGTDAFSTAESLRASGNSTCRGGIFNRSAYWVSSLLDMRSMRPVFPEDFLIYYKSGNFNTKGSSDGRTVNGVFVPFQPPVKFQDMPKGLRMIAGDPSRATPRTSSDEFAHRWKCSGADAKYGSSIPDCPVGSLLYQEVFFPQCWDGKNLDSPDHRSHLSWATRYYIDGYQCPTTHPYLIPNYSGHIDYTTDANFTAGKWKFSSDDHAAHMSGGAVVPGSTLHFDYFEAWSPPVKAQWEKGCLEGHKSCNRGDLGNGTMIAPEPAGERPIHVLVKI